MEILELRGHGDGVVPERDQRSVTVRAKRKLVNKTSAVAEREHLLARQRHAHRAFERAGRQHRKRQLILRAQPGPEAASDIRREHAHLVARQLGKIGDVVPAVLRSLGLVICGNAAVGLPYLWCSTGMRYSALTLTAA